MALQEALTARLNLHPAHVVPLTELSGLKRGIATMWKPTVWLKMTATRERARVIGLRTIVKQRGHHHFTNILILDDKCVLYDSRVVHFGVLGAV